MASEAPVSVPPWENRVVVRPLGTPLPLGFLGLFVATVAFSAVQLGYVPDTGSEKAALAALGLTVPVQLVAAVLAFLARDTAAGTGMGVLAGTWAAVGLMTLSSPPGATSRGFGVVLVGCGIALLVPTLGARQRAVAATVMGLSAVRFLVTGIAQGTGNQTWLHIAGWTGLVLAAASLYAAFAFELEDTDEKTVLPIGRRGTAATAVQDDPRAVFSAVARTPGVRRRL